METMMSDAHTEGAPERQSTPEASSKVRYPTNHVVAIVDREAPLAAVVESLTSGGFLESEIHVAGGKEAVDRFHASTGRGGLAGLAIRVAEKLGMEDDEMALKAHYEQSMRDGGFLVAVAAPTDERKEAAADVLRTHGAHSINFLGRVLVEAMDRA